MRAEMKNRAQIIPARPNLLVGLSIIAIIAGVALRVYGLSFFEFKTDQALAIQAAHETVSSRFLISHGMASGPGIPNPPVFYWLMGVLSMGASTPTQYALVVLLSSIAAIGIWIAGTWTLFSKEKVLLAAALLSISPPLIVYSSNIWAQAFLPVVTVSMFISCCHFLRSRKELYWIIAIWLNAVAAGLHLSGFFLFPFTFVLALYQRVSRRGFVTAVVPVVVAYLPYSLYAGGYFLNRSPAPSGLDWPLTATRTIQYLSEFGSADFFRYYLGGDFGRVVNLAAGAHFGDAIVFLGGTCGAILLYAGIGFSVVVVARRIDLRASSAGDALAWKVFALAGLQVLTVTGGYMLFSIRSYPHYFIATVPSGAVLCSFFLTTIPSRTIRVAVAGLFISSTILLDAVFLTFLKTSGGHYLEYGVHYGVLKNWGLEYARLRQANPGLDGIDFHAEPEVLKTFSPEVARGVIDPSGGGVNSPAGKRVTLRVWWDHVHMAYRHEWSATP